MLSPSSTRASPNIRRPVAAEIVISPQARDDLFSIYMWVAEAAGFNIADAYDARLRGACLALSDFPGRGAPRDDLGPGIRTIVFERKAVIAYRAESDIVEILAISHRGRDLGNALD